MKTRLPFLFVAPVLLLTLVPTAHAQDERGESPPNIVFILADDLGWHDVGYHGSEIRTPTLDRLAAGGVRLEQHYVWPTCSPSRVALLTGRNPSRYGVTHPMGDRSSVPRDAMRLVRGLGALGYTTHISGKWHIGAAPGSRPLDYGFDTSYGYLRGQVDPYTHYYKNGDRTWHRNDRLLRERGHATDLITEEAVRVIEAAGEQPFFLYVAYSVPHYPLAESPKWVDPYDGKFEGIWRKQFAASVTHMDHGVGRIIDALERTGQRKSTLIIFSSDNGGQKSWSTPNDLYNGRYPPHTRLGNNEPLRGWKTTLYEGGIRVPAFANWPGHIEGGRVVETPIHIYDWTPTLIKLAGGKVKEHWKLDGRDLWPLITGQVQAWPRPRTFCWDTGRARAVRHGDWKLIVRKDGPTQLFNIAEDPYEEDNVAEQRPQRVNEMLSLLCQHHLKDDGAGPDRRRGAAVQASYAYEGQRMAFVGEEGRLDVRIYKDQPWDVPYEADFRLTESFGETKSWKVGGEAGVDLGQGAWRCGHAP